MKALARRLCRLEERLGAEGEPRKHSASCCPLAASWIWKNSSCQRTLCADGTVCESITLASAHDGREVTNDELDDWIATFPIVPADGRIHLRRLPPP